MSDRDDRELTQIRQELCRHLMSDVSEGAAPYLSRLEQLAAQQAVHALANECERWKLRFQILRTFDLARA